MPIRVVTSKGKGVCKKAAFFKESMKLNRRLGGFKPNTHLNGYLPEKIETKSIDFICKKMLIFYCFSALLIIMLWRTIILQLPNYKLFTLDSCD